ncbi:hypothetical protein K466DRAFT_599835 [Polyporus arcularius HHB13444]|uniref:DUF6534 domain-containing protein n=1 Tax=Polyporus arcularius HHB13444 TaxID=1314778 RepID=A0A5C3PBB0_9APHY|nr:hypothetical protein K466DRAFT_599835 [Polyporus arcularius HHB13444]
MSPPENALLNAFSCALEGAPPELPALDNTYGALFIGTAFGLIIYGVTVHQTYRYFRLYPPGRDQPVIFWMVIIIWILETFQTAVIIAACYWHLVTNFFNPASLGDSYWATQLLIPTSGVLVIVCESFYARRVWYIGQKSRYIVLLVGCIMLVLLGFTIAATYESFRVPLHDFPPYDWLFAAMFGLAATSDAILTIALITILLRSRTGFKRTDSTVEVLVIYTINTGLVSLVFAVLAFTFSMVLPGNLIYMGIGIVSVKLYANCVLAVLNSRRSLSLHGLNGFETTISWSPAAPHTHAETWDVPQGPRAGGTSESLPMHKISFSGAKNLKATASGTFAKSREHAGVEDIAVDSESHKDAIAMPL